MIITPQVRRRVIEAIPTEGAPLRELAKRSGVHISNVRTIAKLLEKEHLIFMTRASTGEKHKAEYWAFVDEATKAHFAAEQARESFERYAERTRQQAAERRAKRATLEHRSAVSIAAERREEARRLARDAKEAKEQRERAEKASLKGRLKRETAKAGALVFKEGTLTAKPAKSAWADMQAFVPDGLEPVELPNTLRDRFTPEEVPPLFSSLRPGQYIAPAPAWLEGITA